MPRGNWTDQEIIERYWQLVEQKGRHLSSTEFNKLPSHIFPSAQTIRARFGSVKTFREKAGAPQLASGPRSTRRAQEAGTRSRQAEIELAALLIERFGAPFVHYQAGSLNGRLARLDFAV